MLFRCLDSNLFVFRTINLHESLVPRPSTRQLVVRSSTRIASAFGASSDWRPPNHQPPYSQQTHSESPCLLSHLFAIRSLSLYRSDARIDNVRGRWVMAHLCVRERRPFNRAHAAKPLLLRFALIGISIESNEDDGDDVVSNGSGGFACVHLSFCVFLARSIYIPRINTHCMCAWCVSSAFVDRVWCIVAIERDNRVLGGLENVPSICLLFNFHQASP